MPSAQKYFIVISLAIGIGLVGCSKNDVGVNVSIEESDILAVQKMAETADSIAEFIEAAHYTIDDVDMLYDGLLKTTDPITPIRWGRHVRSILIKRDVSTEREGDSVIVITITRIIPAELRLGIRFPGHTIGVDSIIKKKFTERVETKVRFVRIARKQRVDSNWAARSISMVVGNTIPDSSKSFSITSLEVIGKFDTTITDPLNTYFRYGRGFRSGIPIFFVGDSLKMRTTILSKNDSSEVVVLRHGTGGPLDERRRLKMLLVSSTPEAGKFKRIYERTFIAGPLPRRILAERFNATIDAWSYNSLFDNNAPVNNEFWGLPYIVIQ